MVQVTRRNATIAHVGRVGALVILLAGAVALVALALPMTRYPADSGTQPAGQSTAAVVEGSTDLSAPAVVDLRWSDGRTVVVVPNADGVVTSVNVAPARQVQCGGTLLFLNGLPVTLYCARQPLWRPVSAATTGTDADEFFAFVLRVQGGGEATRANLLARFNADRGRDPQTAVDPGDVVWSESALTLDSVSVTTGARVRAGSDVLVGSVQPRLASATLRTPLRSTSAQLFNVDNDATQFVVSSAGSLGNLDKLEAMIRETVADGAPLPTTVSGLTKFAEPLKGFLIPPSALVSIGPDRLCVYVLDGNREHPISVSLASSGLDGTIVEGNLRAGEIVSLTPPSTC